MKKSFRIILFIAIIVIISTLFVACAGCDEYNVDGYYYSVDEDKNTVDVLKVEGDRFTVYTVKRDDVEADELLSMIKADVENQINVEGVTKASGSCSYTNNSFVESRLDLKYDDGNKVSTYAYLKEDTFAYSPKFGMVCLYALIGFAITLVVLCILMGIIKLLGVCVEKATENANKKKAQTEDEQSETKEENVVYAKGTAGEIRLENVSERDCAMVMAIVADQLGEPLNTLRFISIKDITDQEEKK